MRKRLRVLLMTLALVVTGLAVTPAVAPTANAAVIQGWCNTSTRFVSSIGRSWYEPAVSVGGSRACQMSQGSVSSGVRVLQVALYCSSNDPGPFDGNWGPGTTSAVLGFQRSRYGMAVDGAYGPQTHNGFIWWPSSPNQTINNYDCIESFWEESLL